MPATYEGFYQPVPSKPEYECDVLIFGTAHADRVPSVRALLQYFNTHVYGERWDQHGIKSRGLVFGEESLSVLNSATITAVFCRTRDGHAIIKPYLFDFPAAGALVATDYLPGLERYFMLNREIIVFSSNDELIEKIKYYLDHPRDADAVRRAGRVRVLQDHTWRTVWPKTLRVLARNLNPDS
jgi:spore maturation protein CgeB